MLHYFKRGFWDNAFRDELTWLALAVDLVPVFMVLFMGWRAEALVLLYWAENVIIGLSTLVRLGWACAKARVVGLILAMFLMPFFAFHYGMFCFGHGIFVFEMSKTLDENFAMLGPDPTVIFAMVEKIRHAFPGMTLMMGLIVIYQMAAAIRDYWPQADKTYPMPWEEMFAPYGRIVTLHIAIIFGAMALMAMGEPVLGVFLMIVLRMGVSIAGRAWRDWPKET